MHHPNRNCAQCFSMANCKKWRSLIFAQNCPDFSKGPQQSRDQALTAVRAVLNNQGNK